MSVDFFRFFVLAFLSYKAPNVGVHFPNLTEMFENEIHFHFTKMHTFCTKNDCGLYKFDKIITHSTAPFNFLQKFYIKVLKISHFVKRSYEICELLE